MRFPIEYDVEVEKAALSPQLVRAPHRPEIAAGPPPDFGGSDTWWSPEHMFVAAVASCFVATFESAARAADLPLGALRCRAKGMLGRLPDGVSFTSIHLLVDLHVVPDDVERARIERETSAVLLKESLSREVAIARIREALELSGVKQDRTHVT